MPVPTPSLLRYYQKSVLQYLSENTLHNNDPENVEKNTTSTMIFKNPVEAAVEVAALASGAAASAGALSKAEGFC